MLTRRSKFRLRLTCCGENKERTHECAVALQRSTGKAQIMPPRRILILSNFFTEGHGGTPESVLLLAREMAVQDIGVDVFCDKGLTGAVQMRRALPAADDDAAFSTGAPQIGSYAAVLVAGSWNRRALPLVLRAALKGIPITYAAKGCLCRIEFERLRDWRRVPYFLLVEWLLLVLARRIVFSSRVEQQAVVLPRWLWKGKAVCLPEPFWSQASQMPAPENRILTLGFLAEISSRKGVFELIEGFGYYLAARPQASIRLKIAGGARHGSEAYFQRCRALARGNGADAHIEWCAPMRGAQRDEFYRSLDVFVCPSRFESFGLTPLEALWQGVPVCAAPAMGVLEYLHPDAPVLRLPSLGKEDIAGAIAELADHFETWRGKGRTWRARQALMRSNTSIAAEFSQVLLDANSSAA
jgi:glycosyltransferase involved in cell wall biosynthesis